MTVAPPGELTQASGWLHGHDDAVLERAAEAFGLSLDSLRLLTTLKDIGTVLHHLEVAAWAEVGLTPAQGWVLAELVLIGPCTQLVLARRLTVTSSSISQVATRLADRRLLTRRTDAVDRRIRHLTATPAARAHVLAVVPVLRSALEAAETVIGSQNIRMLLGQLTALTDTFLGTAGEE